MSGICGLVSLDGAPVDTESVRRMAEAAAYRGPDGIHCRIETGAAFAYLASHIVPESVGESQPLADGKEELVVVADARIDNRGDLIPILAAKQHLRREDPSDAELILGAYRCWGTDSAAHLIGDFAFALWDQKKRRFFAARDAMALRPFYYRLERNRVLFASEVKQILAAPEVPVRLFEPAVAAHLAGPYGRLEWTFYDGIAQLPPGCTLSAEASGHHVRRYWDIDPNYRIEYADDEQYAEHFRDIFQEAVRCRLRSIKPVGISLSGGMDSGSIASTAGWLLARGKGLCPEFHAYCWAFDKLTSCDERHVSDRIVRHYGLPVTYVPGDDCWPLKDYPAHGPDRDEPFLSVYQALIDRTLETVRAKGMGLLLVGERGDDVTGGWVYDHAGLLRSGQWRAFCMEMGMQSTSWRALLLEVARIGMRSLVPQRSHRPPSRKIPPWIRPEFASNVGLTDILQTRMACPDLSDEARQQRYRLIFSLSAARRVTWRERDQARFGLAFADPWSDQRLVRFFLALPQYAVHRRSEEKRLSRNAMRGIMPEGARRTAGKIEPAELFHRGFRQEAKTTLSALITKSCVGALGYCDENQLQSAYAAYLRGEPPRHDFWWPLSLEMWLRQYWVAPA